MNNLWRIIAMAAFVAAQCASRFGQSAEPPVVRVMEMANDVFYRGDTTDTTKLASDPRATQPLGRR